MEIDSILHKINSLQVRKGNLYYTEGLFPSQRFNRFIAYEREDNNIFSSALVHLTLMRLRPFLNKSQKNVVDTIVSNIESNYPLYSKDGLLFNFYPTHSKGHFPHGILLHKLRHFRLPNDADATSVIYLSLSKIDGFSKTQAFIALEEYGKRAGEETTVPSKGTVRYNLFNVWFTKTRFFKEVDISVLCNTLSFVFQYNLEQSVFTIDSLRYIQHCIVSGEIEHNPLLLSPSYASSPVIIYHIARLFSFLPKDQNLLIPDELSNLAEKLLDKKPDIIDSILLCISLYKLGRKVIPRKIDMELFENTAKSYSFYLAPLLRTKTFFIPDFVRKSRPLHIYWKCEAHTWSLLLEYIVLSEMSSKRKYN